MRIKTVKEKKYGITAALCVVIGTAAGSGVFIKGGKILSETGGNLLQGVNVVVLCGLISLICSLTFAVSFSFCGGVNGLVGIAEASLGKKYAYYTGWFLTTVYTPALTAFTAFFSGMMFCELFGLKSIDTENGYFSGEMVAAGAVFIMTGYAVNALSPKLSAKLHVSMTVVRFLPLLAMGIAGTAVGLSNESASAVLDYVNSESYSADPDGFIKAVVAFAFSFEGLIFAEADQSSEINNFKRKLPAVLIAGSVVTVVIYSFYIFSLSSIGDVSTILGTWPLGQQLIKIAFENLFGKPFGTIAMAFVMVSCLGTMNTLIMSSSESLYSLSARGLGPLPEYFADVDKQNSFCIKSALFGMVFSAFWYLWSILFYWNGPDYMANVHTNRFLAFEPDELCIINLYLMYIPMFAAIIVKMKKLGPVRRFVLPVLSIACSMFMCWCCWKGCGWRPCIGYLVFFAVDLLIGKIFIGLRPEDTYD